MLPKNTSPKLFAKKLQQFVRNTDYQTLSENCRREANKFDISKTTKKVLAFYRQVISGS